MPDNPNISGWTVETLHYHVKMMLDERQKQLDERFRSSEQALERAASAQVRRDEAANEWRGALDDTTNKLMTRIEWGTANQLLVERFERHDERLTEIEKALALIIGRTGYVNFMGLLAGMSILVSIALVVAEIVRWR